MTLKDSSTLKNLKQISIQMGTVWFRPSDLTNLRPSSILSLAWPHKTSLGLTQKDNLNHRPTKILLTWISRILKKKTMKIITRFWAKLICITKIWLRSPCSGTIFWEVETLSGIKAISLLVKQRPRGRVWLYSS